jgi:hypothetical protein
MCDPISIGVGVLGGMAVSSAMAPKSGGGGNAAAEAAKARADAANKANATLAMDQRRRRQQSNLLAGGAADETLGGPTSLSPGQRLGQMPNVLGGGAVRYDSVTGRSSSGGPVNAAGMLSPVLQQKRGAML